MSLMVGKGFRGGICHSIYRYIKANNKYIKERDEGYFLDVDVQYLKN